MRCRIHYILIVLVFHCLIMSRSSYGFKKEGLIFPTSPHCGIYCVYAAARYCGTVMDFVDLESVRADTTSSTTNHHSLLWIDLRIP